jgi:D-alanine--poly(phosphoribitol) ligase subunit 1
MTENLGLIFNQVVKKNQNSIAIKFNNNENLTFSKLNLLSEQYVKYFGLIKLKKKDRIAIESNKNSNAYAMIIASLKMGISYTFIDFTEAQDRSRLIIKQLKPKIIFTFSKKIKLKNNILLNRQIIKKIKNEKLKKFFKVKNKSEIAYIMFTSGSTGRPKGVKISHSNLIYLINWAKKNYKIKAGTTITNLNPLHFDNSIFDFYCSIFNESSIIPINKFEIFNFKILKKKLNILKCNIWFSVPSLLNLILKINSPSAFRNLKIQKYIFGGEPFPIVSVRKIFKYINKSKSKIYNVSGPTECTCICSSHLVKKNELFKSKNISIGKINKYFRYKIKYYKQKNLGSGELFLEGPAVSSGYINDKKMTQEKFYSIQKNFRGYKTGDIVKSKDNKLFILGRTDNQIKILGHRIELEEIENKVNQTFGLSQSLIISRNLKDFPYKKLLLVSENKSLNKEIVKKKLSKKLPKYMLPEDLKLVDKFEFNKNGKIDRKFYEKKFK